MKRFKKLISRFFDNKKDAFKANILNSEEEFLKKAANYVDKGDIKKAISTLEEAEKLIPSSAKVLSVLAKLYKQVGEPEIAGNYIKESLHLSKVEKAQVDLELPSEMDFDFLSEKSQELQEIEYSFDNQENEEVASAEPLKKRGTIIEINKTSSIETADKPKRILNLKSRKTSPDKTENKYSTALKIDKLREKEHKGVVSSSEGWVDLDKKATSQTNITSEIADKPKKILSLKNRKVVPDAALIDKKATSQTNITSEIADKPKKILSLKNRKVVPDAALIDKKATSQTNITSEIADKPKKILSLKNRKVVPDAALIDKKSTSQTNITSEIADKPNSKKVTPKVNFEVQNENIHQLDFGVEIESGVWEHELSYLTEPSKVIYHTEREPPKEDRDLLFIEATLNDSILSSEDTEPELDSVHDLDSNEESFYGFWSDDVFEEDDGDFEEGNDELYGALESVISLEERARTIAVDFIATFEWEKSQLPLLMEIFSSKGWRNIKTALEREVSAGATFEEIQLAYEIKTLWQDSSRYWINFNKAHCPGESTDATYRHCSWKQVLRLIKFFGYQPIFEEVHNFLEFEFEFWFNHEIMRKCFPSFNKYLFNYRLNSRNMTSIFGYFEKTEPYDEMDKEWYFYTNSFEINELKEFGVDLHSKFTPKNYYTSDIYTHDYLLELYNLSNVKSTTGDSTDATT